jgi:hypothetical protein
LLLGENGIASLLAIKLLSRLDSAKRIRSQSEQSSNCLIFPR